MAVRLAELVESLGGRCDVAPDGGPWIRDVRLDSRQVARGDLFAALPGRLADGARFVDEAVARGAAAILSPGGLTAPDVGAGPAPSSGAGAARPGGDRVPVWVHPEARRVAGEAAAIVQGRPGEGLWLAGVTGTNGKTTVAHLAGQLLERAGRTPAVLGTVGHRVGGRALRSTHTTPDAPELQRLLASHRADGGDSAVLEVSSHALDQDRVAGLSFDVAVFTGLSRDHLDYHGSMEQYADVKARLFASLRPGSTAVILADDPYASVMRRAAEAAAVPPGSGPRGVRVLTYSTRQSADLRAFDLKFDLRGSHLTVDGMGISTKLVRTPLVGRFNAQNALAALAVVLLSGASPHDAFEGLASVTPPPGRLEPVDTGDRGFHVFVDYAHTPAALAGVLDALREGRGDAPGRIVCVFGCGGDRDRGKRAPMGRAAGERSDRVIATSDNPRHEDPLAILDEVRQGLDGTGADVVVEPDRRLAIELALRDARPGDVVLIAGKGHETQQVVGDEARPFDDRAVAREVLA